MTKNVPSQDEEIDAEIQKFIQQTILDEGERGCVEQEQFDDILQNEQSVHSPTTQEDND